MKKIISCLIMALAIGFAAPAADASELQEQRKAVWVALLPVIQDVSAQRLALVAERDEAAERGTDEWFRYQAQIRVLSSRQRYLNSMRFDARYRYNGSQLNTIISRYDLAVSLS